MKNIHLVSALLLPALLVMAGMATAQQASDRCPALPASSGLQWQERANTGFLACKAQAADNGNSMNLLLTSRDPDIRLSRSRREEPGVFSGRNLHWYVPELAGQDEAVTSTRRIAVVELGKDQYAQIWLDAKSPEALAELQALAAKLDISAGAAYLVSGH